MPSSQKNTKNNKFKGIFTLSLSFFLFLSFLGFAVLVPVGAQTFASKAMDSFGQYQTSLLLDTIASGNSEILSQLAGIDLNNPSSCQKFWNLFDRQGFNINQVSGKQTVSVDLKNPEFKDKFAFKGYIDGSLNTQDLQASGKININTISDTQKVASIFNSYQKNASLELTGIAESNLNFESILNQKDLYLKLANLNLNSSGNKFNYNLDAWYKQQLSLNATQEAGISKIKSGLGELSKAKPGEILSEQTGKYVTESACDMISKLEIQSTKTEEFGYGGYRLSKENIRPVKIILKDNYHDIYYQRLEVLAEKLSKDDTLKSFIKNNYTAIKNVNLGFYEISNSSNSSNFQFPNQEEYSSQIDQFFGNYNKEEVKKSLTEMKEINTKGFSQRVKEISYFLNPKDSSAYGYKLVQEITFSSSTLSNLGNKELETLLKDGVNYEVEIFDLKYNSEANKIQLPSTTQDIKNLPSDILQANNSNNSNSEV